MACINKTLPLSYHCNAPSRMPFYKYEPWCEFAHGIPFDTKWPQRQWPMQRLLRAPRWCSVDLRDGNQALVNPMDVEKKLRYFRTLVAMGFKEIEIGFPAASQLDFDFTRLLIEKENVRDDVWLMVLVQARESLIRETIEALKGAKNVIIHLYNSTSELQRRVVFNLPKQEIKAMAARSTQLIHSLSNQILRPSGCQVRFQYSPESFTSTEVQFSLEVCHSVMDAWGPTEENPIILNLPETVQNAGPHFYADQIEWMHTHLKDREKIRISVHPHNDRGTGVASAELAMQAGADRVEGCLFGNGERTGNVCLVTLAVNFLHHGIDPELDLSALPSVVKVYEECTGMSVPERHPWVGSLVYTAFSGSHQDAIKKGLEAMEKKLMSTASVRSKQSLCPIWEVPYLPIDPKDLGRSYEAIVRINSQSGKSGVAFVMESEFGILLPRGVQIDLSKCVQLWCDETASEVDAKTLYEIFRKNFLEDNFPVVLVSYKVTAAGGNSPSSPAKRLDKQQPLEIALKLASSASPQPTRVDHKRLSAAITPAMTPTSSDRSTSLSPKRRDLGRIYDHVSTSSIPGGTPAKAASDLSSSSSRLITPPTESSDLPGVDPPSISATQTIGQHMRDTSNGLCECPSSEWLVIDRPILTDHPISQPHTTTTSPSYLTSIQSTLLSPSESVVIDGQIMFTPNATKPHRKSFPGSGQMGEDPDNPVSAGKAGGLFNFSGRGNGPMDAFISAFNHLVQTKDVFSGALTDFEILSYHETAIGPGGAAEAICFVELKALKPERVAGYSNSPSTIGRAMGGMQKATAEQQDLNNLRDKTGKATQNKQQQQSCAKTQIKSWGAARHPNTTTASLRAICSAINHLAHITGIAVSS